METLVCIAIVALLAAVLIPALGRAVHRAKTIGCVSRLKNMGLGLRTFAVDYAGAYPWRVAVSNGGFQLPPIGTVPSPTNNIFYAFATISNMISTPIILRCPADRERLLTIDSFKEAASLGPATARYPSYFLGTDATEDEPSSMLSGDRNLLIKSAGLDDATPGNYNRITTIRGSDSRDLAPSNIMWSRSMHNQSGNLLLGDGSVQQCSGSRIVTYFTDSFNAKSNDFHFFFPAIEN